MHRVVQWATGNVGREAVAAVHRHADLELVGALVYDETKSGRDIGEVCGIAPVGVTATGDRDEILALDADCVVYMANGEMDPAGALDDICALLESGKNVVSTAVTALIYPASAGQDVVDRLEAACAAGGVSFHGTGIEPGWAGEVLPLTMSGILGRVESIVAQELMDYSTYDSAEMMSDMMGFGQPPDAPVPLSQPELAGQVFRAPLMLVADGLGAEIERFEYSREVAVATEPVTVAFGTIAAGTVSASAAAPGIRTFLDLPMICGRGVLT